MSEITTIARAMVRHGLEPDFAGGVVNLLLQAEPADFAHLLGLDPGRVCAIVERMAQQSLFSPSASSTGGTELGRRT